MSQLTVKSRKSLKCLVFGCVSSLPTNLFPTYMDVMRHYQKVKQALETEGNLSPSVSQISSICSAEVESLSRKASIPIVSHALVLKLIRTFHDEFRTLMKPYNGRKDDRKYIEKLQNFQKKCREKLFDIAACKYVPESCKCPKSQKIPKEEQKFMTDQRTLEWWILQEPIGLHPGFWKNVGNDNWGGKSKTWKCLNFAKEL